MADFIKNINSSGTPSWIIGGVAFLFGFLAVLLVHSTVTGRQKKKNAIFSNSKNKYKDRIGKKVKY